MQGNEDFTFFINGELHGDHVDETGEYQRQLANLERQLGVKAGSGAAPITLPIPVQVQTEVAEAPSKHTLVPGSKRYRDDLTPEETAELERIRHQFETTGEPGIYHADHEDASPQYNTDFERYMELMGIPQPEKPVITTDGRLGRFDWKERIAQIIHEERLGLQDKI